MKKAQRFGRYILLDKVASGGMAEVRLGAHVTLSRDSRTPSIDDLTVEGPEIRSEF